nr:sodium:proton antiporter [Synergistes sp.]
MSNEKAREPKTPSLALSVLVFLIVAVLIGMAVLKWETDIHLILIFGALLAGCVGVFYLGNPYSKVEKGVIEGIMVGMQA